MDAQMITRLDKKERENFKRACMRRGHYVAEVVRKMVKKVGDGDTALLDRIVK